MRDLSARLSVVAEFVKSGSSVCDVGTDHGYLPAFLYLSGKCKLVTATDIKEKPLKNAQNNLKKLGADGVSLILCDGLAGVDRSIADTVIIAGMGGEVISGIIADEAAIGMVNCKTTAVRVIPAIGKKAGEELEFGGLFGSGPIMNVNTKSPAQFINRGGKIPAPLHSLKN